ncbi:FAD:protein FMN transferase [Cohnella nanjingensis]|nr:FAD:protein FMN transferase [Cohnella nanjingensis]
MDTVVDIQVVARERDAMKEAEARIDRAFEAFRQVEQACSRFSPDSELMIACRQVGTRVPVSPLLFEPLKLALEMAKRTNGIFDPTVGKTMEALGFNRHYLTGQTVESPSDGPVTYRDVVINEREQTIYLHKPMVIDLGAVAKGFAIDLAAHELKSFEGFLVNAGGDLYAGGSDEQGKPWKIGIRHPVRKDQIIFEIDISDRAICTSGSYERPSDKIPGMHHIIDPGTQSSPRRWISCSVIATYAMMADVFSTAAFVMDAAGGEALIEEAELQGIFIASDMQIVRMGGI